MDFTTFLWTTFGAFLTLCTFSFLYKDNPFYKFAEHLVVGAAAGYFTIILWHNGLVPKLMYDRLDDGSPWLLFLDSSAPWYLIPAFLGVLMWTRFSKNYAWISRWPLAMYIGIGAGAADKHVVGDERLVRIEPVGRGIEFGVATVVGVVVLSDHGLAGIRICDQRVIAIAAFEQVRTTVAVEDVVARAALDPVVSIAAVDVVGAARALQGFAVSGAEQGHAR